MANNPDDDLLKFKKLKIRNLGQTDEQLFARLTALFYSPHSSDITRDRSSGITTRDAIDSVLHSLRPLRITLGLENLKQHVE